MSTPVQSDLEIKLVNNLIIHQFVLDVIALQNKHPFDFERFHDLAVLENFDKLTSKSEEVAA